MFSTIGSTLQDSSWFGDGRLCARFGRIAQTMFNNFGHSMGQSTQNKHQSKAAYNFMNNAKVDEVGLYSSDAYRLCEETRQASGRTYVSLSDTTVLNFSQAKSASRLDCLDDERQKGYFLHSLMLMDEALCPAGLLRSHFYNRPKETLHHTRGMTSSAMAKIPIEEKESHRWLADLEQLHTLFAAQTQHRFVHVVDSEGDLFELFAARRHEHIHLLARVHHDRKLLDGGQLKAQLRLLPPAGQVELTVTDRPRPETDTPRRGNKKKGDDRPKTKRRARLELRYAPITVQVPYGLKQYQKDRGYLPLQLYVVHAREQIDQEQLEKGFQPIEWFLITSMPIQSNEAAIEAIAFYAGRWRIEDFHLVLKEGAKVERLQYESPQALKNAITLYSIVALQVLRLRYLNDTQPDLPMQVLGL